MRHHQCRLGWPLATKDTETMTYIIRAATLEDAAIIAPLLREADKNEIAAMFGGDPTNALKFSIRNSDVANIAFRSDDTPLAIFGLGVHEDVGVPWMMATDELKRHVKDFLRLSWVYITGWSMDHKVLTNYVDARNTVHINWLTHMGFTVVRAPYYIGKDPNVPFYVFYRSN